jgi:arginine repressor
VLRAEGWWVTQSSVSRDIAALRLVKSGRGHHCPPSGGRRALGRSRRRRVAEDVGGVESAGESLILLHTPPGEASAVGLALDRLAWTDIVDNCGGR